MRHIKYNFINGAKYQKTTLAKGITALGIVGAAVAGAVALGTGAGQAAVGGPVCNVPVDYATIQAAVNDPLCTTINVAPGLYAENVNVNRTVTINGAQAGVPVAGRTFAGAGESIVDGVNPTAGIAVFTVNAPNVVIDGFSITNTVASGAANGITVNTPGNSALITNNIIDTITSPDVSSAGTAQAVYLQGGPDNVEIVDNRFNNILSDRSAKGILLGDNTASNAPDNILISGNTITNVTSTTRGAYGISVARVSGLPINGLQVLSNTISNLTGGGWAHAVGLEGNTPGAVVTGNTVSNISDLTPTPINDAAAVFFEANPSFNTVEVHNNNFNVAPTNFGVALHPALLAVAGTAEVDAECNWWNSVTGPTAASNPGGTGAQVTTNVDYKPWLLAPAPGATCIGGNVLSSKDQCKNGGWATQTRADGSTFKNQGDCIQYANTGR